MTVRTGCSEVLSEELGFRKSCLKSFLGAFQSCFGVPEAHLKKEEVTMDCSVGCCKLVHGAPSVKLTNLINGKQVYDTLHLRSQPITCNSHCCRGSLVSGHSGARPPRSVLTPQEMLQQAREFLEQYYVSIKPDSLDEYFKRWNEVKAEVEKSRIYTLTSEELIFGAKLAWRNATRCIGRIQWRNLEVQDARHVQTTQEMYEALCHHLEYATNGGNLRSMITIFPPRRNRQEDFRLWNPQLINYAGYFRTDGSVVGDPANVQFTRVCQRLGWKGKGGRFDILPWIVSAPGEGPKFYDVPEELILRVKLEHPRFQWFKEMELEWYAVPAVANMLLDCGGIEFPAAPFNGWYMGSEIGARDLCDPQRYNITKEVALKMGLDTTNPTTLWKDRVLVEINIAVLYSYQKQNVTIVDHHTATQMFMKHMENEQQQRGGCPADWVWIVPPISSSVTPVFHQEMLNYILKPSYEYQEKAWKEFDWKRISSVALKYKFSSVAKAMWFYCCLMVKVRMNRIRATILYASETGKAETFAIRLGRLLENSFNTTVICMEDYNVENLTQESLFIVVCSTFGNGDPPHNGKYFWRLLCKMKKEKLASLGHIKFSVFALGSSQYPTFCAFGKNVDETLIILRAERLLTVGLGDDLRGQEQTFNKWAKELYKVACNSYSLNVGDTFSWISFDSANKWSKEKFRTTTVEGIAHDLCQGLTVIHNKNVQPCRMLSRVRLQPKYSERQKILVRLNTEKATNFTHEPGDHLGIFPVNPSSIVNRIMAFLDPSERSEKNVIKVETLVDGSWQQYNRLPPCTIRTALSRYLDITTPPTPTILEALASTAEDECDEDRLKQLCEDIEEYESWKMLKYPSLAEVLEQFPSINVNAAFLLTQVPLLQPRYYSISSAPKARENEIHLTVSLVRFCTEDGNGLCRLGVCTSYLNSIPTHDVPCFIRSTQAFHMPTDRSLPVIMIGAGSGIAPFRSFWQQRELEFKEQSNREINNRTSFGEMVLFFGCWKSGVDTIYEHEISSLVDKGILHKVCYAFSRQAEQKKAENRYHEDIFGVLYPHQKTKI
ncbi:nitric oxide synthase, inducible-like isoform X2 [Tachypleus tridentatus]|uniref:nitric oxide synthase, inducible-like isoform X2 n=1 Tax=Tachypleus tridentatus TaxID=6853 RepID=UPI003FD4E13E